MSRNPTIAFVGLGAMGYGMASHLLRNSFQVVAYEVSKPIMESFAAEGGHTAVNPHDAASKPNVKMLICMVATSKQATSVFFDENTGAVHALPKDAIILLCITASPNYVLDMRKRLDDAGRSDLGLVDCPVSGGANRAADGTLSILASGYNETLAAASSVLQCMSAHLHVVPGGIGSGSKLKLVHQIFVGINIAITSEVVGLAKLAGLNLEEVHEKIMAGPGASWLFGQRVSYLLGLDVIPASSLEIITKDMAMVTAYGRACQHPLPLSSIVEQIFLSTISAGWGHDDDSAVLRLYLLGRDDLSKIKGKAENSLSTTFVTLETIEDLLAGVHLAASAEVVAFGHILGIDTELMYNVIKHAAGSNAMFMLALPQMQIHGIYNLRAVESATTVRDGLKEAIDTAGIIRYPLPISSIALQQYYLQITLDM